MSWGEVWAGEMQSFSPRVDSRYYLKNHIRPGKRERISDVSLGVHGGFQQIQLDVDLEARQSPAC